MRIWTAAASLTLVSTKDWNLHQVSVEGPADRGGPCSHCSVPRGSVR